MDAVTTKSKFRLEEASIAELHDAIRTGETTCRKVVEHYLARIRTFNGVSSMLVTPAASRAESGEMFLLAKGFKGRQAQTDVTEA